jgi:hypothetical protein
VLDGRNCLDGRRLAALGVNYCSVGHRPAIGNPLASA